MTTQRLEKLEQQLILRLARPLAELGFAAVPRDWRYRRKTRDGVWSLHIGFIEHTADVDLTADVAIRHEAVEEIVNREFGMLSARERKQTATVGAELGNIADGRQRRWTLADENTVQDVADSVLKEFITFGLPYLERLSDPHVMLEALSHNDATGWLHSPIHGSRCSRAVAMALVLGESERARTLAQRGEAFLAERRDPALLRFRQYAARVLR